MVTVPTPLVPLPMEVTPPTLRSSPPTRLTAPVPNPPTERLPLFVQELFCLTVTVPEVLVTEPIWAELELAPN